MLTLISLYLAILFSFLVSPLSMGLTIIAMTATLSFILMIMLPTSWFSFLLIMIFLSAMMVIFVYISALAANEITFSATNSIILAASLLFFILMWKDKINKPNTNTSSFETMNYSFNLIYKIYMNNTFMFTLFLIIYLLLALIVTVKNASISRAPLRMKLHSLLMKN